MPAQRTTLGWNHPSVYHRNRAVAGYGRTHNLQMSWAYELPFGHAFYDPLAFNPVIGVRFGSSGRNILRGPGLVNVGLGLFRNISLTERWKLQFRAEAFNAGNTPHFGNPAANVSNRQLNPDGTLRALGGFMAITGAVADERQFRFGLRLNF